MYNEIYRQKARRSQLFFSVQRDPNEVKPFCVQFGGGGHYFDDSISAVRYCAERRWIKADEIVDVFHAINERLQGA